MTLFCVLAKVVQFYGFVLNDYDTGIYGNVAWNLAHGEGFHSDVLNQNHLGIHFSPLTALFAPIYAVIPSPMALMIGQGLAVGLTLFLLYRLGERLLDERVFGDHRPWIILAFCLLAFVYGPFTNALLYQFHPPTLVMPVVAGCLIALIERRTWLLILLIPILLSAKENTPLAIAGFGIYAALVQCRWRLGISLGVVAVASLALILLVVMPAFQDDGWIMAGRFRPSALLWEKTVYLLLLLLPLGFLPLLAWRTAAAALPLIAVNLAAGYEGQLELKYHYNDMISVFLLVAAMQGFDRLMAWQRDRSFGAASSRLRVPNAAGVMTALILAALVFNKGRSPITDIVDDWPTAAHWRLHQALAPYRQAPPDQAIVAQSGLGPYVSSRRRYVMLETGWSADDLAPGDLILLSKHADDFRIDIEASRARLDASTAVELVHASGRADSAPRAPWPHRCRPPLIKNP